MQAISLLVQCAAGQVAAVPLVSRIHEGLVFSNRDASTLLDKLVALLLTLVGVCQRQVLLIADAYYASAKIILPLLAVLIADAYYASAKIILPLLAGGHHLLTRAKGNVVAYWPAPAPVSRGKGRPKLYGHKVRLKDAAKEEHAFIEAPSPVYGENTCQSRQGKAKTLWSQGAT
ncbi:hypothetical protein C4901_11645 [Acidiferrobacter sp. SPIII_3]|uniref:hypothetical protein n=1 Tax=Acidiferrobacter sp. SPIII_3 TaxID=1281578 RepID=UPI000D730A2C|nr:hypothetical protein [Acidiferrobacter sp. SPIII_3]AWP23900.1 hypothetical protein C4901_11645 [Acidiferrobacter sp. SPIII_3]